MKHVIEIIFDERSPQVAYYICSKLYQEFIAEREEILRHKWIESEKEGKDIGFERALLDWIRNHREDWRKSRSEDKND